MFVSWELAVNAFWLCSTLLQHVKHCLLVWFQKCVANPKAKGMPMSSFLLKPMQRITKYPLLIKEVLPATLRGTLKGKPKQRSIMGLICR